jgi:plasmid maintenance system antidote protein VapI
MTDYYANPRDAWRVRELLDQADLTEEAAARALEISEPTLRSYRDGKQPVPRNVILALERLVDMRGQDEA